MDTDTITCQFCGGPHDGMTTLCADTIPDTTGVPLNYRTPNERYRAAERERALTIPCPTCDAEPGDPCTVTDGSAEGTPMFLFHPARTVYGRTVAPRQRFGRCACGRPINTEGASACAECD